MSAFLLALSIGPVQEFIAAARRTRDLWFGSHLLSELSRAAARAVADWPGVGMERLIFPAPKNAADLETAEDLGVDSDLSVANIILTELPSNVVPLDVAKEAHEAVKRLWQCFASQAWDAVEKAAGGEGVHAVIREDLWRTQIEDAIEFYAAWTLLSVDRYGNARARVMRLLAGRKACRNFIPGEGCQGVPKSSLDGRRESVLENDKNGDGKKTVIARIRRELRLNKGEQLCAIGLTKRQAGGTRPYPSVSRIAAEPWLHGVQCAAREKPDVRKAFEALKQICRGFRDAGHLHALDCSRFSQYAQFPFEGTCLYPTRFTDWKQETGLTDENLDPLRKALEGLGQGEPDPYLAILVADGDHMGRILSKMKEPDDHRSFSRALAQFASSVYGIVQEHFGVCIFAGGDDVLAFVPVHKSISCAQALHKRFSELRQSAPDGQEPTLSVGIAIGHCMEPLEDLRAYGLQAEAAAKHATPKMPGNGPFAERNGIAVTVHPRSGVVVSVREQWQAGSHSLDMRLNEWARLFSDRKLPGKLPYDLHVLADELDNWSSPDVGDAIQAELRVLLTRKQVSKDLREDVVKKLETCDSPVSLRHRAEEMLVAQWIAAAQRQAVTVGAGAMREDEQ